MLDRTQLSRTNVALTSRRVLAVCKLVGRSCSAAAAALPPHALWMALVFAGSVLVGNSVAYQAPGGSATDDVAPAAASDQVATWIRQLDAGDFQTRRDATRQLIESGSEAIMPVAESLRRGSRESVMRGLHVLEQLALSDDVRTREAALTALHSVVEAAESPATKIRAQHTIVSLQRLLQQKALVALRNLGADVSFQDFGDTPPAAIVFSTNNTIELSDKWQGTADDLQRLEFLFELDAVALRGEEYGDAYLEHLHRAPRLNTVVLSRTSVTDQGMSSLMELDQLRVLQVLYTPITDASLESLESLPQIRLVELCGTKISPDKAMDLGQALANATVKYHRGAFLGVGPGSMPQSDKGLVVGNLAPGSAADKAGIQIGDLISQVGKTQITSFDDLSQTMQSYPPGVPIDVTIVRNDQELRKSVTLIERPDELANVGLIPVVPIMPRMVPVAPPPVPQGK